MKKLLTWLIYIAALTVCLAATAETSGIPIDETTFPDDAFRAYVLETVDMDDDAVLSDGEIAGTGQIGASNREISDLTGIEYFTSITVLSCINNELSHLDVSKNTALTTLDCYGNDLKSLDVSSCTQLQELNCGDNKLTALNLDGLYELKSLNCYGNRLTSLDISDCAKLDYLHCSSNWMTSLDVAHCTKLEVLNCVGNKLTKLDVSKNTLLKELDCGQNQLTYLDVTHCPKLKKLTCGQNQLTSLNLSHSPNLEELDLTLNQLTCIDLSACPDLEMVSTTDNHLTSLDVSHCPYLRTLFCGYDDYSITVNGDRVFNLNRLPGNFDASKSSNWIGGTVHGSTLTVDEYSITVYYDYDVGRDDLQIYGSNRANFKLYITVDDTLPPHIPGDASGDGQIDLYDALAILRIGKDNSVIVENGDVNADGESDIHDALLLIQREAGWGI